MKKILFTVLSMLLYSSVMNAQVMIGSHDEPQPFSILELEGEEKKGLRMPQLSDSDIATLESSEDFIAEETDEAKGLVIYNMQTKVLEFWDGTKWMEL